MNRLIVKDGRLCIVGGRLVTSEGGAPCVCGDDPPPGGICTLVLQKCEDTRGDLAYFLVELNTFMLRDWPRVLSAAIISFPDFPTIGCFVVVGYTQEFFTELPDNTTYLFTAATDGVAVQTHSSCNESPCTGGQNECGSCFFPNTCRYENIFSGSVWNAFYGIQSICFYGAIVRSKLSLSIDIERSRDVTNTTAPFPTEYAKSVTFNASSTTRYENRNGDMQIISHSYQQSGSGTETYTEEGQQVGPQTNENYNFSQSGPPGPTENTYQADRFFGGIIGNGGINNFGKLLLDFGDEDIVSWGPLDDQEAYRVAKLGWAQAVREGHFNSSYSQDEDYISGCSELKSNGTVGHTASIGSGYRSARYDFKLNSTATKRHTSVGGPGCPGLVNRGTQDLSRKKTISASKYVFFYKRNNEPPDAGGEPCPLWVRYRSCTGGSDSITVDIGRYETTPEVVMILRDGVPKCFSVTEVLDYSRPPVTPDAVYDSCDDPGCGDGSGVVQADRLTETMTERNNRLLREQGYDLDRETRALQQGGDCGCSAYTYTG